MMENLVIPRESVPLGAPIRRKKQLPALLLAICLFLPDSPSFHDRKLMGHLLEVSHCEQTSTSLK
jgi:hypothetical protein